MSIFEANAAELERLQKAMHDASRLRSEGPQQVEKWHEAARAFHAAYDRLAFPGGITKEFELLQNGDAQAIEMAVRFLEADPWYFRSGYHKETFLRALRKQLLSDDQCARLRRVILSHVRGGYRRETRAFCRFATRVADREFEAEITAIAENSNRYASRHAQWVIHCLKSARRKT